MEKLSVFVDVQNIYYTTVEAFNAHFDYNEFWSRVTSGREVVAAFAYAISKGDEKQKQFQNILRGIGFEVKLKPFIKRSDGSAKGDWDVGMTIDIMEYEPYSDVVVLVSGDGDFDLIVDKLVNEKGKKVEIYGVEDLTSSSLIKKASVFHPVGDDLLINKGQ